MNVKLNTIKLLFAILSCGVWKLPVSCSTEENRLHDENFKESEYYDEKNGNNNMSTSNYQVEEPQNRSNSTDSPQVEETKVVDISNFLQRQQIVTFQDLKSILSEYSPDSKDQFASKVFNLIISMNTEIRKKVSLLDRQHKIKVDKLEKTIRDNQYNYNNKIFDHAQKTQEYKMAVDTTFDTQARLTSIKLEGMNHILKSLKEQTESNLAIINLKQKKLEKKLEKLKDIATKTQNSFSSSIDNHQKIPNPFQPLTSALENLHSIITKK